MQHRTDNKEAPMNDSLAYRIGFHPSEDAEEQPSFNDKLVTRSSPFPGWDVTDVGESGFEAPKSTELPLEPNERW